MNVLDFHFIMGKKKTTEEFVKECKDKNIIYDLSKITYNSAKEKVCAICPEHGEFWITPDNLLQGRGCPKCAVEKNRLRCTKGIEKLRKEILKQRYNRTKKCDFYIEKYNVVIECQGKQHIGYIEGWNTEEKYKELLSRDIDKYYELNGDGIKVYYLFDKRTFNPDIYTDKLFQGIYNSQLPTG